MKILITSGGTRVKIDSVRHIGNMSNGTLGAKMAKQALSAGHEVIFFRAEKSKSPMQLTLDFDNLHPDECRELFEEQFNFHHNFSHLFYDYKYVSFEDYQNRLEALISLHKPDMIILAAAVSDYAPETVVEGKIRSKSDLSIHLKPLPKVISEVRKWAGQKAYIVGFKLLFDVSFEDLIEAATQSAKNNDLDCVCANDLRSVFNGKHTLYLAHSQGVQGTGVEDFKLFPKLLELETYLKDCRNRAKKEF